MGTRRKRQPAAPRNAPRKKAARKTAKKTAPQAEPAAPDQARVMELFAVTESGRMFRNIARKEIASLLRDMANELDEELEEEN